MPVKHYEDWKKSHKGKLGTWKEYKKYVESKKGGNFGGEIHYYKTHHITHDDHKAHEGNKHNEGSKHPDTGAKAKPDLWDEIAHNNEISKRIEQLKKDKEDGKLNHIYKGASAVRKILVPSHTEVTPEERMAAHLSNASKVYHEFSGNPETKQRAAQQYLDQVDMGRDYRVSDLSNTDGLVVERGSILNNEFVHNGDIEIAYRGTNKKHLGDLKTDARLLVGMEEGGSQDMRARQQIEAVKERYGANSIEHFTGYSKGGGQALIYGARENVRTTALNPLIGKTMMAKQNTTAPLKVLRTTGDAASIGLMGSNHPYEVKTFYPIKTGALGGLEPITQTYQEHRLENFISQDARQMGAGTDELLKLHGKSAKQGEMENLNHAIEAKNQGKSFTEFIHELQQGSTPATESHRNTHADHSIVNGEKRLAGQRHGEHSTAVRNWETIGGSFTPQEAAYITGRNNPYDIPQGGEFEWGAFKKPTREQINALRDEQMTRLEKSFGGKLTEGERLGAFDFEEISGQKGKFAEPVTSQNTPKTIEQARPYRNKQEEMLRTGEITKAQFDENMGKFFEKKSLFKRTQNEYNYNQDVKKIKRGVREANERKLLDLERHQAEFGEGHSNTLTPQEYNGFIEAGREGRMEIMNRNNAEIATHSRNTSEHFAPPEHTSGTGLKSLASSFHPTSLAMGFGAGYAAEKSMDLIDPEHNIPLVPRDLLVGGAAGAGGYGMSAGLGVAGEKLVERGLMSAAEAELAGLGGAGIGLAPEIIAGGAGYLVGDLAGRGTGALIKELGGDKDDQEWGSSVLGGAAGGATTGAIIGSFIPVVGTAIGAGVGGVGGAIVGALSKAFSGWF